MKLKAKIKSKLIPAQLKFLYENYEIVANAVLDLPSNKQELQDIILQVEQGYYAQGEFLGALKKKLENMNAP